MIYLGLDIGSKTVGLAISNTGIIATSYKTLRFSEANYANMYNLLKTEINEKKADVLVIGYPKNMNNTLGEKAKLSLFVKEKIEKDFPNIKVFLEDERLTTKTSMKIMSNLNKKIKDKKLKKDELSAEIILQTYLNRING